VRKKSALLLDKMEKLSQLARARDHQMEDLSDDDDLQFGDDAEGEPRGARVATRDAASSYLFESASFRAADLAAEEEEEEKGGGGAGAGGVIYGQELSVAIGGHRKLHVGGKDYTVYEVDITTNVKELRASGKGREFVIERRFNEFRKLRETLKPLDLDLPTLPPGGGLNFLDRFSAEKLKLRKVNLERLLKYVAENPDLYTHPAFLEFCGVGGEGAGGAGGGGLLDAAGRALPGTAAAAAQGAGQAHALDIFAQIPRSIFDVTNPATVQFLVDTQRWILEPNGEENIINFGLVHKVRGSNAAVPTLLLLTNRALYKFKLGDGVPPYEVDWRLSLRLVYAVDQDGEDGGGGGEEKGEGKGEGKGGVEGKGGEGGGFSVSQNALGTGFTVHSFKAGKVSGPQLEERTYECDDALLCGEWVVSIASCARDRWQESMEGTVGDVGHVKVTTGAMVALMPQPEVFQGQFFLQKKNRRGQLQPRMLCLSDQWLYNCTWDVWVSECKWALPVSALSQLTVFEKSPRVLTIHVKSKDAQGAIKVRSKWLHFHSVALFI
jgi:hypothetical protein